MKVGKIKEDTLYIILVASGFAYFAIGIFYRAFQIPYE